MGAHFHPHPSANPLQVSRASPPIHAISLVDLCFIEPLRRWGRTSGDLLIRASELPRHDEMSTRSQRHHDGSVDATTARDVLTLSRCRSPLSVALTVGATAAGITLASGAATISDRLLSSLRYREIVVSTKVESSAMKLPARAKVANSEGPNSVAALTADDLHQARSVSPAVQYAYTANPVYWRIADQRSPRPQRPYLDGMEVTPDFFAARNLTPAAGSLFAAVELDRRAPSWCSARNWAPPCSTMERRSTGR